jgi:hypothetical protein
MAGVVHVPWYSTVFRGDKLAAAVSEVSALALRYGATQYRVHRSRDDAYKLVQMIWFDSKLDWERYWEGPEMTALRTRCSGWYQVPVLYVWHEEIAVDAVEPEPAEASASA